MISMSVYAVLFIKKKTIIYKKSSLKNRGISDSLKLVGVLVPFCILNMLYNRFLLFSPAVNKLDPKT